MLLKRVLTCLHLSEIWQKVPLIRDRIEDGCHSPMLGEMGVAEYVVTEEEATIEGLVNRSKFTFCFVASSITQGSTDSIGI